MLGFTVAAIAATVALAVPSPAGAAGCVTIPPVAHRGGTERYVENTANSFRDATNRGVPLWETDVRFTSDDVPVIMHDPDVDRTTDGTGLVASLSYADLAALRTADGQPVPTLAQLINDAEVDGAKIFVELKVDPTVAQWATFLAAMTSRAGMTGKLTITSFDTAILADAAIQAPAYARGLIQDVGDVDPATVTPYAHILIKHHNAITASRMTKWNTGGLTVYSWTVDTTDEMARMAWYPTLAGVITDTPGAYLAWQKSRTC